MRKLRIKRTYDAKERCSCSLTHMHTEYNLKRNHILFYAHRSLDSVSGGLCVCVCVLVFVCTDTFV